MGLFVREDGYYHGWLASILCCCAAVGSDEHPAERSPSRPNTRGGVSIVQTQPSSHFLPPYPLSANRSHCSISKPGSAYNSPATSRDRLSIPSSPLKPLDFGGSTLFAREVDSRDSSVWAHPSPLDHSRHGLIPLRLAPVVLCDPVDDLSDSVIPTTNAAATQAGQHERSNSGEALLHPSTSPASYRLSHETPFQRLVRRSTEVVATRRSQLSHSEDALLTSYPDPHLRSVLSTGSSSRSLQHRQSIDNISSTSTSRSSNDSSIQPFPRLKRKGSTPPSLRLGGVSEIEADRDAIELNTITEQDSPRSVDSRPRHEHARSHLSTSPDNQAGITTLSLSGHVPAVAPSMQMHVRSETLNDIGSALSRPATARIDTKDFDDLLREEDIEPDERGLARARPTSQVAKIRSRSGSRVSGWLNSIRGAPADEAMPEIDHTVWYNTTAAAFAAERPTLQRRLRKHSNPSWSSTATSNAHSPSLTTASSPVSAVRGRHSRNLTAESRTTILPSTATEPSGHYSASRTSMRPAAGTADLHYSQHNMLNFSTEKEAIPGRSRDSTIAKTEQMCEEEGWLPLEQSAVQVGIAF